MLDFVESVLARWTGRSKWPSTEATLESRLQIRNPPLGARGTIGDTDTSDIFSYEVQGQVFVAAAHEVAGRKNIMGAIGNTVDIQYNPKRPRQIYYAPACQLASRACVTAVLLAGALAIAYEVHLHG